MKSSSAFEIASRQPEDPRAEGIRNCLICGKKIRVIEVEGNSFQVEPDAKQFDAEHLTLIVKYDMHHQHCNTHV